MTLTDAILQGKADKVTRYIEQGTDLNAFDIYGYTPLIEAAIANLPDIAKQLIINGADVNKKDLTGGTALHWAVENSSKDMCELLLSNGADVNAHTGYGQPAFVIPLLRGNEELKELFYRYNVDLHFAQDYINTKLIGHRFELMGSVDILNSKKTFIELDFEGFILEFTVGVILNSLKQFKNNFASRNLRSHFAEFDRIIQAFENASELLSYQQHLIDLTHYRHRLAEISEQELILFPVGFEGHAITFIKYRNYLAKCDRGANSLHNPSIAIYKIGRESAFDKNFFKQMLYEKQNSHTVGEGLIRYLQLEYIVDLPFPSQLIGNCSWANVEAAVPAMLLMQWLPEIPPTECIYYQKMALAMYKQWIEWDKDWALLQCIESFHSADPARKASKAALLAAVLFQTCRYTVPNDLNRADKILKVLATPDYKYVLDSYCEVYKNTPAGHNLNELIDLYSQ